MDYQEAIEVINNHERYVGVKYVNGIEEAYVTPYFEKALNTAISAMQELQEYKQLGTLEEMKILKVTHLTGAELAKLDCAIKKLNEYKKLGTLEEVRDAVEKQKEERPQKVLGIFGGEEYECKNCGSPVDHMDDYCKWCGKAQDWSDKG